MLTVVNQTYVRRPQAGGSANSPSMERRSHCVQQHTGTKSGTETKSWPQQALAVNWLTQGVLNSRVTEAVETSDRKR
jgi:hypothetical protein